MNIIAISGSRSVNKTETIDYLHSLMIQSGFNEIGGNFGKHVNFWSVLIKNGKKTGVTTYGDTVKSLTTKLDLLNRMGCEVIVCTSLIWGQTIDLIENKPGFKHEYFYLTPRVLNASLANHRTDALKILARIEQLI